MNSQYIVDETYNTKEEGESFNPKRWLLRVRSMWPWFLVSIAFCLGLAFLYLRYTNPVYSVISSIMVKDEQKGAELMDNSMMKEIGLGGNNKLVENEIEILKSYDLMESVVSRLQLFTDIQRLGRVRDVDVYGDDMPFRLIVLNPRDIEYSQKFAISDTTAGLIFPDSTAGSRTVIVPYDSSYSVNGVQFRVIRNKNYREPVISDSSRDLNNYQVTIKPTVEATDEYSKRVTVAAVSKVATVISIELVDANRNRGVDILRTLVNIYNEQGLEDKNRVNNNTIKFLGERLVAVTRDLESVEGSVERFKSENRVTDLSADAQNYLAVSQEVDVQKAQSQTQLNIINALEKDLADNQANPKLVPSTLGIQEPSLGLLIERHNSLVLSKERMELNSGPRNPLLIDQQNQIKELRASLLANVRNLKRAYAISLDDISKKDLELSTQIRKVPMMEKRLLEITRNQTVQQQLYSFLLQKREEAAVQGASNIEDSRTVIRARSLGAISPKPKVTWAAGLVLGFLLPIGFITLKDFFNNKIGDLNSIKAKTSIPVIGSISHVKKFIAPIVITARPRSVVSEQIRNIRTSISYSGGGKNAKIVLITSYQPGDGKSFVSMNLAAAYSLLNKKTVLLEFDLRKPRITKDLGLVAQNGLSSYLSGKSTLDEILVQVPGHDENFQLIPAGFLPPNPAELISGSYMEQLINELKEKFDTIIIDTPPFSLVTDASLLQRYADVSLVILRQDYTQKTVFQDLKQIDSSVTLKKPTYVVVNGVGKSKRYQSYKYDTKGYYSEEE
ncbi:MAG: polysaccharide biosynthesis tyrosine autokinase [Chitinophagaceae bacterium]|nr:MAG: polysaccharide biosynthesis tyrosine autokinase [Chitinophagaceae bacterium]